MKAYWLETGKEVTPQELTANGIDYKKIDPANYQPELDKIKTAQGYIQQDIVEIKPDMPNLDVILAKFDKEHIHTLDEVRYVLAGGGIFDIRSTEDKWMRVEVYTGDYISVPAERNHRFYCTAENSIKCVRLFQDTTGWTPIYREKAQTASV